MPFPTVWGIPEGTPEDTLRKLRRNIVSLLHKKLPDCPKSWIRPFFPVDWLDEPIDEDEGTNTIYVSLETGMFSGALDPEQEALALSVVTDLANLVFEAFKEEYEVECFIGMLNPKYKKLITARRRKTN